MNRSHQNLSNNIYFVWFRGGPHFPLFSIVFSNDIIMTSFLVTWFSNLHILWNFNASVNSKRQHPPPRQPPGFCTYFQPRPRDLYHLNCPGVARGSDLLSIIKVPSCQLMPHEDTSQLLTDLPSIAALLLQNLFQSWGKTLKL